jgi:hypothetical protein
MALTISILFKYRINEFKVIIGWANIERAIT